MTKTIILILMSYLFLACKSTGIRTSHNCPNFPQTGYSYVQEEKFPTLVSNDTVYINELKYYCSSSAMKSKKVLFDKYGPWDYRIFPNNDKNPVLFWDEIQIFKKDTSKYTIAAHGKENYGYIYNSFIILNSEGKDVLANPVEMQRFKSRLGTLLKSDNSKNRAFYEVYWKSIDPAIWERIKSY